MTEVRRYIYYVDYSRYGYKVWNGFCGDEGIKEIIEESLYSSEVLVMSNTSLILKPFSLASFLFLLHLSASNYIVLWLSDIQGRLPWPRDRWCGHL